MAITIKSEKELEKMRIAAKVLAEGLDILKSNIHPGINCLELDKIFSDFIFSKDCKSNFKGYHGFPNTICISINEQLIHGIPQDRVLKDGDIVSIDAGCIYQGYHADSAITVICGSKIDDEYVKLIRGTEEALLLAIEQVTAGVRIGTISALIQDFIESKGYHLPVDYAGHGIGKEMHEDPMIPNTGVKDTGQRLVSGMTICIEPMVQIGTNKTVVAKDGWTVSSQDGSMTAHFEHTILVTDGKAEILTARK